MIRTISRRSPSLAAWYATLWIGIVSSALWVHPVQGQTTTALLQERVYIKVTSQGTTIAEIPDGTQGGTGPVAVIQQGDTELSLPKFVAEPANPLYETVHAYAEGLAAAVFIPDDPMTSGDDQRMSFTAQTDVEAFATGLVSFQTDTGNAEAESRALLNTLYEDFPSDYGSKFRYTLTWALGREGVSQFTHVDNNSFVQIDEVNIPGKPVVTGVFDSKAARIQGVFERAPDRIGDPLLITVSSDIEIAHKYPPDDPAAEMDPSYFDFFQQYVELINLRIFRELAGTTQSQALTPDVIDALFYRFENVPSRSWFDPTPASGFTYDMLDDDVLFDEILDFPTGLGGPVTVSVDGQVLGQYGPGDNLSFVSTLGQGVSRFDVTGISPFAQADDTPGFALQLEFSEETASFSMTAHPVFGVGPKTMLSPVAVVDTNLGAFSMDTALENMFNQSGLEEPFVDGQTPFDAYFQGAEPPSSDIEYVNYWQSEISLDEQIEGFVEFDLGEVYAVDRLAIWNGTLWDISVLVAESLDDPWQEVGQFTLTNNNPLLFTELEPQILEFGDSYDARYVRIDIDSAYPLTSNFPFKVPIVGEIVASVSPASSSTLLAGDFNGDGVVDGTDFLIWQRGESPKPLSEHDLADWEANYGMTNTNLAAHGNTVPEPTSALLLMLAVVGAGVGRGLAVKRIGKR